MSRFQRLLLRLTLVFVSCLASEVVASATPSGNELLQRCGASVHQADGARLNEQESANSLMCLTYLEGWLDSHAFDLVRLPQPLYCLPQQGFTVGQLARMVVKTLSSNPQKLHEDARLAVGLSLMEAFPCRKPSTTVRE